MTLPKTALLCLALFVAGTGLGYWLVPTKVKTVEHVVTKEVVKKVVDVDRTTTTTHRPDGTTTTVVVDKTKEKEDSTTDIKSDKSKVVEKVNKDWLVGGGVMLDKSGRNGFFGLLGRRVLGEIYIDGFATSNGQGGLGLTFRF